MPLSDIRLGATGTYDNPIFAVTEAQASCFKLAFKLLHKVALQISFGMVLMNQKFCLKFCKTKKFE